MLKGIKPMGLGKSIIFSIIPMILLFIAVNFYIPEYSSRFDPPILSWFLYGSVFVFVPMFVSSIILYKLERSGLTFKERFRLWSPRKNDLLVTIISIAAISAVTFIIISILTFFNSKFTVQPFFMQMEPLKDGQLWVLLLWLPMFFFNIFGEAFFWRGYIYPRQEVYFGNFTWFAHGTCWMIFHLPFGSNLLIAVMPIIYITSYAVQKTKNTYVDIIIHAVINGSGFLMIALGVI